MFVHISQFTPLEHAGGVATFAADLSLAIPDLHFLAHGQVNEPWNAAESINLGFLRDGKIGPKDTIIADGYYGAGLSGNVERLIVVCHSTYAGWLRDNLMYPHTQLAQQIGWLTACAKAQEQVYHEADQLVAVSTSAQEELHDFYGLEATCIYNGIDVELFKPAKVAPTTVVEVAGDDWNKGCDIIEELKNEGWHITNLGYEGTLAQRWARPDIALFPSRHEGGPYCQLEAMATNKRIIGSKTGFFKHDVPSNLFLGTEDLHWVVFDRLLDYALSELQDGVRPNTRQWVLENATLDRFIANWRTFLGLDEH